MNLGSSHLNLLNSVCYWIFMIWFVASIKYKHHDREGKKCRIWFVASKKYEHLDWEGKSFPVPVWNPFQSMSRTCLWELANLSNPQNHGKKKTQTAKKINKIFKSTTKLNHQVELKTIVTGSFFRPNSEGFFTDELLPTISSSWSSNNITLCFWNELIYSQRHLN